MQHHDRLLDHIKSAVTLFSSEQLELAYANQIATSWLTAMLRIVDEDIDQGNDAGSCAKSYSELSSLTSLKGVSFQRLFPSRR